MKLEDHPTVQRIRLKTLPSVPSKTESLNAGWLKQLVLDAGADDVGFVEISRPALDDQREDIIKAFPHTRTLISFVVRMNREAIRTPARSVSNLEFHHSGEEVNDIARSVVQTLEDRGIRAMNPAMGFPMEMGKFPGKVWVVSHKPVAVAAGLGMMGIHRNVIHPKFGNFILLGTILLDAEVSEQSRPIDYNPCLECRLCVAAPSHVRRAVTLGEQSLGSGMSCAFTQGLSREVGSRGITVNNVQPGPIDTDLNPATGDWAVPQKAATALDRYGHVDEVAALVAFVAGPESSYITGANLTVDGGMNA
jgi:hypothetical protein